MAFIYDTYGPFDIERDNNKLRKPALNGFWEECDRTNPGLSGAVGIYIISVRAKKDAASKPWYVGRTDSQGFRKRVGQQIGGHFSEILDKAKNGKLQIFLIARRTPNRRAFMKTGSAKSANDALETMMIGSCLRRNQSLVNARKIKHLKGLKVPGYLNNDPGKMTDAASELNRMVKAK
jgi:hypothetical protein